jgi:hypothetical protein
MHMTVPITIETQYFNHDKKTGYTDGGYIPISCTVHPIDGSDPYTFVPFPGFTRTVEFNYPVGLKGASPVIHEVFSKSTLHVLINERHHTLFITYWTKKTNDQENGMEFTCRFPNRTLLHSFIKLYKLQPTSIPLPERKSWVEVNVGPVPAQA